MGVTLIGTKFKSILKNGSVCDANQVAINGTNLETYLNSMSPICEFDISNISNNTSNFYSKTIIYFIISLPPIYGLNTSGTVMLPSSL